MFAKALAGERVASVGRISNLTRTGNISRQAWPESFGDTWDKPRLRNGKFAKH